MARAPVCERSRKPVSRLEVAAVLLLLTLSLGLRVTGLQRFIANDEMRWTCRSIQFREALRERDWAGTFRVGHPGVVTTWLGAAFIPRGQAQAEDSCRVSEGGMELDRVGTTPEERTRRIADLGQLLFDGRVGVSLFTTLCLAAIYPLMRLSFGPRVAVLGLGLIALDPFYLALSRVLHVDAVLASLMVVSMLAIVAALCRSGPRAGRLRLLALSGIAGGLAMLQKSPALFLMPWTALLLAAYAWREGVHRRALIRAGRDLAVWTLVVVVVYVALWPAMWADPLGTIERVVDKAIGYAEEGHEAGNYFLGTPVQNPGWGYYPVATLFRMSPLVLIGLIGALCWLARDREPGKPRSELAALLLYIVLFGAFMSLGAKKFDRYLLPVFPALGIVAAVGLLDLAKGLRRRLTTSASRPVSLYAPLFLIVVLVQGALALPHYPHYLTYYNPLLGGLAGARDALVVGWGEGYEEAAAYLNGESNASELQVAVPTFTAFAPLFSGETRPIADYSVPETDYVVFYLAQVQRQHDQALMEQYFSNPDVEPEHTVALHGVEYAWIYRNRHYVEPMSTLEAQSQPGRDVLLVNGDSVFGKHYRGALEVREFRRRSSPQEVARLLDDLPPGTEQIWYPRYSDIDPEAAMRLLRNRGLLVDQAEFSHLRLVRYRLLEEELPLESLDLRFGDLRLSGYAPTQPLPAWGRDGGALLRWESDRALRENYTAFAHLYDSRGNRIAQGDNLIVNRDLLPTSQWESTSSGTILHHLSIPAGTPPGRYELRVGAYVLETGERLPLLSAEGEPQGNSARLEIEVGIPERMPQVANLDIEHPLEQKMTSGLELLGYDLEHEGILAGEPIPLHLYWRAVDAIEQDYRLQVSLRAADGEIYGRETFSLVSTGYPTTEWRPGEVFQEWYDVSVGGGVPTGDVTVTVNLVNEEGEPVPNRPRAIAELWVQSTRPSFELSTDVVQPCEFTLGGRVDLLGYDVKPEVSAGDEIDVTVYWRARQQMGTAYKVFVHLYDAEGEIVAQQDRVPGLGARPTTTWQTGEIVADRYTLRPSSNTPAGQYRLVVGLYDPEARERLPVFGAGGERLGQDYVPLGRVEIRP